MARQVISFLFTDIVDSTALFSALGPDRADEVRRAHDRAVSRAVEAAGGSVVKHLGDGMMAAFPGPSAACDAAIAAQLSVTRSAERHGVDLAIRAGIALGEATEEDGDWFGLPVIQAARLCAAAGPGEILIADGAAAMGTMAGELTPVGLLELKGLEHSVPASRVAWITTGAEPSTPLPAALRSGSRLPFVGRAETRRQLEERWKAAAAGRGGLVLVAGEPGIGKSRLVAELAASIHAEDVTVSYGRCDQDSLFPYQPFVEAVRHLHDHGAVPRAPGLELLVPGIGEPPSMDPDRARTLVMDAARSALRDAATDRPLLLVFDDLHWADGGTLAMLRHLLRDLGDTPLLIVGTYRDTDVDRTHPFGALLADLRREGQVDRVHLSGIDDDDIFVLLGGMAGHDIGDDARGLAGMLARQTSGNPFFVGEVLAHLVESGALANDDGRWGATVDLAAAGLPEGVRDVVGQRLSRLDPDTNAMLAVVAVNGRPIDLSLLRDVWERTTEDIVAAVDQAVAAGLLVEETEHRSPQYAFSHALVRQTLLDELSAAGILRLHARLAEAIASRARDRPDRWPEAIHHAIEGAPLLGFERAGEMLAAGADVSEQRTSPEAVIALVQRFDALGRELGAAPTEPWVSSLSRAGLAAFMLGDRPLVGDLIRRAIELSRHLEDPRTFVEAVSGLGHATGFGLDPEFLALLPEAFEKSVVGTPERTQLLAQQLQTATYLGMVDVAAACDDLVDESDRSESGAAIAGAQASVAYAGQAGLPASRVLHHADRALSLAHLAPPQTSAYARLARTYALIRLRRFDEGRDNATLLATEGTDLGMSVLVAGAHQQLAMLDLAEGEFDAARHHIGEVARHAPNEPMFEVGCLAQHLWLAHLGGQEGEVRELLAGLDGLPYPELLTAFRGWLSEDPEVAASAATELAAVDLAALPRTWVTPGLWVSAANLALRQGHPQLAAQVAPLLATLAGEQVIFVCCFVLGPADDTLADLRALLG